MKNLIITLFGFIIINSYSQDFSISASCDKNVVGLDEQIQLQITVSGTSSNLPSPQIPKLDNFNIYSSGRSQSISIINGQVSSSITFTYILSPKAIGKFTIPPITVSYQGKTYTTQPISIEVVKSSVKHPPQERELHPSEKPTKDIFITTSVDKHRAYVDEQITLTFRFYKRVNIQLLRQPEYQQPDTSGFVTEDLPPQRHFIVTIDGVRYEVIEIKTALFAPIPGKYTIGPAKLRCNIADFRSDDFFDDFFNDFFSRGKTKVLETNPIHIEIIQLPHENKPKNFTGAVGQYTIKSEVDKTSPKMYDSITFRTIVSGTGNIKSLGEPIFPELKEFKKYDTISSFNIKKENDVVRGSKEFTTVLVPTSSGKITIPPVTYNFFDPNSKTYKTITTEPIVLNVQPAKEKVLLQQTTQAGVKVLTQDIRHIKQFAKLKYVSAPLYSKPLYIILQVIPIISFIFIWQYQMFKNKALQNINEFRRKKSYKKAIKQINKVEKQDIINASHAIAYALTEYIADKVGVSAAGLTIKQIQQILTEKNIPNDIINSFINLLQDLDFIRFAPAQKNYEMKNLVNNCKEILKKIEKYIP